MTSEPPQPDEHPADTPAGPPPDPIEAVSASAGSEAHVPSTPERATVVDLVVAAGIAGALAWWLRPSTAGWVAVAALLILGGRVRASSARWLATLALLLAVGLSTAVRLGGSAPPGYMGYARESPLLFAVYERWGPLPTADADDRSDADDGSGSDAAQPERPRLPPGGVEVVDARTGALLAHDPLDDVPEELDLRDGSALAQVSRDGRTVYLLLTGGVRDGQRVRIPRLFRDGRRIVPDFTLPEVWVELSADGRWLHSNWLKARVWPLEGDDAGQPRDLLPPPSRPEQGQPLPPLYKCVALPDGRLAVLTERLVDRGFDLDYNIYRTEAVSIFDLPRDAELVSRQDIGQHRWDRMHGHWVCAARARGGTPRLLFVILEGDAADLPPRHFYVIDLDPLTGEHRRVTCQGGSRGFKPRRSGPDKLVWSQATVSLASGEVVDSQEWLPDIDGIDGWSATDDGDRVSWRRGIQVSERRLPDGETRTWTLPTPQGWRTLTAALAALLLGAAATWLRHPGAGGPQLAVLVALAALQAAWPLALQRFEVDTEPLARAGLGLGVLCAAILLMPRDERNLAAALTAVIGAGLVAAVLPLGA